MSRLITAMRKSGTLLAFFAFVGVVVVSASNLLTRDQIEENKRMMLLEKLNEVLDHNLYANDLVANSIVLSRQETGLPADATIYLARDKQSAPVAAVFRVTTLQGYSGAITILAGVSYADQSITGVRVIEHKETPGLGDKVETSKSNWILDFVGKSLRNPTEDLWLVKRDGGQFDQFTGATITPRAVVGLIKSTLLYARTNMTHLFDGTSDQTQATSKQE